MAKYEITFINANGKPNYEQKYTFGQDSAVDVAKVVWKMAKNKNFIGYQIEMIVNPMKEED